MRHIRLFIFITANRKYWQILDRVLLTMYVNCKSKEVIYICEIYEHDSRYGILNILLIICVFSKKVFIIAYILLRLVL